MQMTSIKTITKPITVLPISPGVASGPVKLFRAAQNIDSDKINADQVEKEQVRLQKALEKALLELEQLSHEIFITIGPKEAAIFEVQQLMLNDPEFISEILTLIAHQQLAATTALRQVSDYHSQQLEALEGDSLATPASDLRDVTVRVTRLLIASNSEFEAANPPNNTNAGLIVAAYDFTPSDIVNLAAQNVAGLCTVLGGPTTHATILAQAFQIPAIAGIDPQLLENFAENNQQIAIDGGRGLLYLQPNAQQIQELRSENNQKTSRYKPNCPATTADEHYVQISANVSDLASIANALEYEADGIGLLRTEFLFSQYPVFPNEQAQFESYLELFEKFTTNAPLSKTIVVRTLDAGGDKNFPALEALINNETVQQTNPALGLRGVRLHLRYVELLRQQLRALVRAAHQTNTNLHILFPMVTTLEEIRRLRAIYQEVRQELTQTDIKFSPNIKLGIMIETPAAALMADVLAREVDFLSIGTNDLYQYVMAVDRNNIQVSSAFGLLEPAVWRLLNQIVQAALKSHKSVAVCGEIAADAKIGPLLVGLGVPELSVNPSAIPTLKAALHTQPLGYWQKLAAQLLKAETASEMQALLKTS